jgi:dTMP kinase
MFIVFEGIDGCGKTTLAKAMWQRQKDRLPNRAAWLTAEPTRHLKAGEILRQHLQGNNQERLTDIHFVEYLALLMAADRQLHYWQEIEPALSRNEWVLCDRFAWSSYAYQSATGMNIEWLVQLNCRVKVPSLTVLIELDIETAKQRRQQERPEELFESDHTLRRVASSYHWLAEQKTGFAVIDTAPLLVLDGRLSTEAQLDEIWARLKLPGG